MSTFNSLTGRLAPQSMLQQRYLIVRLAGRGGMSAVYQAVDTHSGNRRVAIKEMSQEPLSDAELFAATARFQQEAALLGSLHHPNLPRIYDAFSERGRSYLVMDFIDGKTLLQLLQELGGRPLPVAQVLEYARQLCDVLTFLHLYHPPIIFRDLKPTNVMVTESGHIYLIDFGIARFFKEGQTQDTVFLGSPGYAPPEQHGVSQTNPRSDLYALGATLHCCLTGRDPYLADERFTFPPVRQYNPLVPIELEQLIQRLVALDERQRPASALEVQEILLKLRQQASAETTGLNPVMASAPTQYSSPVLIPGTNPALQQPPGIAHTVPVHPGPSAPPFSQAQLPSPVRTPQPGRNTGFTPIWTTGFMLVFGLLLALTVVSSIITFNINQPYGIDNPAGLDHAFELGLSILLLVITIAASALVRSLISVGILILTGLATLLAAAAFLTQTLRDIQQSTSFLAQADPGQLLTIGLTAASIISLLWLARPFALKDRIVLLVVFGAALVCSLLQSLFADTDVARHILLLIALILLIQSILIAVQTERVRRRG